MESVPRFYRQPDTVHSTRSARTLNVIEASIIMRPFTRAARRGPASIGRVCCRGCGLNAVVIPPIEHKAAAQAARSVPALRALGVQRIDSREVFPRRLAGVGAGRPERQRPAGGSWFPDAGGSVRAWAGNVCGPLLGYPPCAHHNRRTPEPRASSTSGTNLFASVAIAICAAARQITR